MFVSVFMNNEKISITLPGEILVQTLPRITDSGSIFLNLA